MQSGLGAEHGAEVGMVHPAALVAIQPAEEPRPASSSSWRSAQADWPRWGGVGSGGGAGGRPILAVAAARGQAQASREQRLHEAQLLLRQLAPGRGARPDPAPVSPAVAARRRPRARSARCPRAGVVAHHRAASHAVGNALWPPNETAFCTAIPHPSPPGPAGMDGRRSACSLLTRAAPRWRVGRRRGISWRQLGQCKCRRGKPWCAQGVFWDKHGGQPLGVKGTHGHGTRTLSRQCHAVSPSPLAAGSRTGRARSRDPLTRCRRESTVVHASTHY